MGSITSKLNDIIKEYGSYDNYLEEMGRQGLYKKPKVKPVAVFYDSNGKEVSDGCRIRILQNYNYHFLNGMEAVVRWDSKKGKYEYQPAFRSFDFSDFAGIHSFEVIE